MFEVIVLIAAAFGGAVASIAGFGIGSLLTPAIAATTGTKLAVALVSIPRAIGTLFGETLLSRVPEQKFRIVVGTLLLALGLSFLIG